MCSHFRYKAPLCKGSWRRRRLRDCCFSLFYNPSASLSLGTSLYTREAFKVSANNFKPTDKSKFEIHRHLHYNTRDFGLQYQFSIQILTLFGFPKGRTRKNQVRQHRLLAKSTKEFCFLYTKRRCAKSLSQPLEKFTKKRYYIKRYYIRCTESLYHIAIDQKKGTLYEIKRTCQSVRREVP